MRGALLRAGASEASGGFGHVGHGGHDGGIGSERRSVRSFVRCPQADVCLGSEGWPVGSHGCDPGMNRDLWDTREFTVALLRSHSVPLLDHMLRVPSHPIC